MSHLSAVSRQRRAQLAAASSNRNTTPERLAHLRQEFYASALADYIEARLATAPLLSTAQYDVLHAAIRRDRLVKKSRA